MGRVILRPTILSDLPYAIGEPLPYRIRAITATVDDRVIGLGGVAFPPHGPAIAFAELVPRPAEPRCSATSGYSDSRGASESIPEAKRYPVAFHRAGLMTMAMIRASGIAQVVATAEADDARAVRWLSRLGFEPAPHQPIEHKVLFVWERGHDAAVAAHASGAMA